MFLFAKPGNIAHQAEITRFVSEVVNLTSISTSYLARTKNSGGFTVYRGGARSSPKISLENPLGYADTNSREL